MFDRFRRWLRAWWVKLRLVAVLAVVPDAGVVRLGDERMVVAPALLLADMRERLLDIGPAGQRFMYETGKKAGRAYAEAVEDVQDEAASIADFGDLCAAFGTYTGWGHIEITREDLDQHLFTVRLYNTPFRDDSDDFTGEYHAGLVAGAGAYILDRAMEAKEVQCENAGDDYCEFDLGPADRFEALF